MKPAIFNTEMVRAILDGRKTQTRRAKGVPLSHHTLYQQRINADGYLIATFDGSITIKSEYKVGDIIYVRETFVVGIPDGTMKESESNPLTVFYKADNNVHGWLDEWENDVNVPWKPSIHMPKEYARLFLRVKDIRIERLNEISHNDVYAEGFDVSWYSETNTNFRQWYVDLWESIYGNDSFDNRYVWVIEFERISKEEAMSETAT